MEIIEQNIKIEHENLTRANYIFFKNFMNPLPKRYQNQFGYILAKVKVKEKLYSIVINADCGFEFNINSNRHIIKGDDLKFELPEIYINGLDKFLIYDQEANIRIINEEDPDEIVFVFTDYAEALEYLKTLD